jgi:flagellar FliL protein
MKEATQSSGEPKKQDGQKRKRRLGLLLVLAALPVTLGVGAAAVYFFAPGVAETVMHLADRHAVPAAAPAQQAPRAVFVDIPEMTVTLPNGGRPRQMKIKLSLELASTPADMPPPDVLSPRVYDALLTYLRTLRDGEVEGGFAIDRMRGDLHRRLSLVLGSGVLRDVLITSLITA